MLIYGTLVGIWLHVLSLWLVILTIFRLKSIFKNSAIAIYAFIKIWIYWVNFTVFASLYSSIILLGIIGNSCVIMAIARIKSLQTVPNMVIQTKISIWIFSVYFLVELFRYTCLLYFCYYNSNRCLQKGLDFWPILMLFCTFCCGWFLILHHFQNFTFCLIKGGSLCFSTFTLAAISVDRFLLILFPTRKAFSHTQALFIILVSY